MKDRLAFGLALLLIVIAAGCSGVGGGEGSPAPSTPGGEEFSGKGDDFFIAIHCEPGEVPLSTEYAAGNWPELTALVESADDHNMKLTLLFNPQWVMYILEDSARLELVRKWEANGHELGLHHHGPVMNSWNGYTNQKKYFGSLKYVGKIREMMVLLNHLPASGQVKTACVNSEDQEFDFPQGVIYATNGGSDKLGDLWSTPTKLTLNGQDVLYLTHARYAAQRSEVNIDLEEMAQLLDQNESDEVMGIVFHDFEYAENPKPFDALFELLDERGIHTSSVSAIMEAHQ